MKETKRSNTEGKDSDKVVPGGFFVVFEGIDGAGKTTQIRLISQKLRNMGYAVITTREPTFGKWGQLIRTLYNEQERKKVTALQEAELFVKDRTDDVEKVILPALKNDAIVLLDRYFYSNIAYQGSRGVPQDKIRWLNRHFPVPHLVILIEISTEEGLLRIQQSRGDVLNAFEKEEELRKVYDVFKALHDPNIERVDGTVPPEQLAESIVHIILQKIHHCQYSRNK